MERYCIGTRHGNRAANVNLTLVKRVSNVGRMSVAHVFLQRNNHVLYRKVLQINDVIQINDMSCVEKDRMWCVIQRWTLNMRKFWEYYNHYIYLHFLLLFIYFIYK